MPIRAVVFDLFDTLVDLSMEGLPRIRVREHEFPSSLGALHDLVSPVVDMSLEDFADTVFALDKSLREQRQAKGRELATMERFEQLMPWLPGAEKIPDLPAQMTKVHMDMLHGQVSYLEHHPEILRNLAERVNLAVCSNFSHSQTAFQVLEDAKIRWHFDAVLISDATGWRKPRREIFEATLGAIDAAPAETLHVGDNLSADVAGAAGAGIRTAWVTRQVKDPDKALREYEGPEPDLIIEDLAELVERIDSLV